MSSMNETRIEEKLKEYRRRRKIEQVAQWRASTPILERLLPGNVMSIIKSKIAPWIRGGDDDVSQSPESALERLDCTQQPSGEHTNDFKPNDHEESKVIRRKVKRSNHQSMKHQVDDSSGNQKMEVTRNSVPLLPQKSHPTTGKLSVLIMLCKFLLWGVLFCLFVLLEWGAVFFIISAFYLIFANMRSGKRETWVNPHEPSAYSVFNPGCEAIDGTLKPEQFEREIRYGF